MGSAVVALSRRDFLSYPVPPLTPSRKQLVHILGTLDDKIELNRRMNETLEAMARAIFKSWFVDFDPVRAKAEGRDPDLPKPIADLFPDPFEDSELGEIPAGGRWCTMLVALSSSAAERRRRIVRDIGMVTLVGLVLRMSHNAPKLFWLQRSGPLQSSVSKKARHRSFPRSLP